MEAARIDLTQTMRGAYTYRRRGLTSELFPDTALADRGGDHGWIDLARGTLSSDDGIVIWDSHTVAGSGVDVVYDLGEDCWLDEAAVNAVIDSDFHCGLGSVQVLAKASGESRYHLAATCSASAEGAQARDAWLRLPGLNTMARYVRLHLDPAGRPPYGVKNIGLVRVQLLGLPLEQKRAVELRPSLYPWPADVVWGNGYLELTEHSGVLAAAEDQETAAFLRGRMASDFGLTLAPSPGNGTHITLLRRSDLPPEAYRLRVTDTEVSIEGDSHGLFYGAVTLLQLLRREDGRVQAAQAEISDRPLSPIRGLHMYLPARENIAYCKRLLDTLASLKLNTAIVEVSGGMRYRSHPEVNTAWQQFAATMREHLQRGEPALLGDLEQPRRWQNSMHIELAGGSFLEQDEVRDLVEYARRLHITLIPEVQTLSHSYWIVCAHPELSERSDTPYSDTYCPSNPAVYPLVFDLLDEVIDVFDPPALSIGHDEAWAVGTCPICRTLPAARLIADDVTRLHDHLAQRSVKMWMWADTLDAGFHDWAWTRKDSGWFLQPPDTRGLLEMIPKDIVALNWWWGHIWKPEQSAASLEQVIHDAGIGQLFANFEGAYCPDYAARCAAAGIGGAILPSWVANAELEMGRNGVIQDLMFSANVLWSTRYGGEGDQTQEEVAARLPAVRAYLKDAPTRNAPAALTPLALDAYVNAPLADATGALGGYDLRMLPTGDTHLGGTPYRRSDPAVNGGRALVAVQGRAVEERLYPVAVAGIAVNQAVSSLVFLHVASDSADSVPDYVWADSPQMMARPSAPRQAIGCYRVHYEDGASEDIELHYDEHLTRWNTRRVAQAPYQADPIVLGETDAGPVTIWRYEWFNRLHKAVASIDLIAAGETDCAVLLLAVTAAIA